MPLSNWLREFFEEIEEFFEDLLEVFTNRRRNPSKGIAQIFVKRINALVKMSLAAFMVVAGILGVVYGPVSTSQLVEALVGTALGRVILFLVGVSAFLSGFWELTHKEQTEKSEENE